MAMTIEAGFGNVKMAPSLDPRYCGSARCYQYRVGDEDVTAAQRRLQQ